MGLWVKERGCSHSNTAFRQTDTMHGHSKLNGIGVHRSPKEICERWGPPLAMGCRWPLPHVTLHAEFDRCWSNSATISAEIRRKIGSFVSHISASFKVIKSDANRSGTYDFLWSYLLAFST